MSCEALDLARALLLLLSLCRDKFTRAQKRKSGAFRSAAVIMNELQRNIDGWEVRQCLLVTLPQLIVEGIKPVRVHPVPFI